MYDSNSWYSVYYHYMHYYPSDIVKLEIGECDDCDIKYMNDDFDLCTNRLNSINSKKINELS